jgi:hypothetical protein
MIGLQSSAAIFAALGRPTLAANLADFSPIARFEKVTQAMAPAYLQHQIGPRMPVIKTATVSALTAMFKGVRHV